MTLQTVSQIAIPILSGASIYAMASKKHKWGFIFGIVGQPFWFYSTYVSELWGMFIISFWFLFNHVRGLINHKEE